MAQIYFYAGENTEIFDIAGSGLGLYGPGGFGTSVKVGQFQDNTYITDPTGAINGPKANNIKYVDATTGQVPVGDNRVLREIPNSLATLNARFIHSTAVQTQNVQVRIFDRNNIDVPAVGVTTYVTELVHPWETQSPAGSGDTQWYNLGGSGGVINGRDYDWPLMLTNSPGANGWSPNGPNTLDTQHDWYLGVSASPDTIGSKSNYALYLSLEYV